MTAHGTAVQAALRAGDELERLIGKLGTAQHPRGAVLRAYRNAERGLRDALRPGSSRQMAQRAAAEVLGGLRRDVGATARELLGEAAAAGRQAARVQAEAQGLDMPPNDFGAGQGDTEGPLAAWLAVVEAQIAAALALAGTGADEAEIIGDEQRAGVLRPAVVVAEGSRWLAGALNAALVGYWLWLQGRAGGGAARETWYHQAVAAIDERTTDCCLRVHGQVQRLDKPFKLTGTPRYADELDHPPFHWYCRSAEAILTAEQARDELTREMVDAARAELAARKDRGRAEIHPAHARSRR